LSGHYLDRVFTLLFFAQNPDKDEL